MERLSIEVLEWIVKSLDPISMCRLSCVSTHVRKAVHSYCSSKLRYLAHQESDIKDSLKASGWDCEAGNEHDIWECRCIYLYAGPWDWFWSNVLSSGQWDLVHKQSKDSMNMDLHDLYLSRVPSQPLARAVSRLNAVNLSYTKLTTVQLIPLLEASLSSRTLVNVNLCDTNLRQVPGELLARAVSRLETVHLNSLNDDQIVKVLESSLSSKTLVNIDWTLFDLSGVPAELLAKAVARLKTANLWRTNLTSVQSVKLLEASLSSNTLENLDLGYANLSEVPAELLVKAVARLKMVNLHKTNLTSFQCVKFLEAASHQQLENLDLHQVNLSQVPAELLAKAVARLKTANLCGTNLTSVQCVELLEASLSSNTLEKLELEQVNLSQVPAELLAKAVARLKTAKLWGTNLTSVQCVDLLEASLSSNTLENLDLFSVNLSQVPAELLAKAVVRLKTVCLNSTNLTSVQCVKLLEASLSSNTLVKLLLFQVNLSQVPAELLAKAAAHLKLLMPTLINISQCI